MVHNDNIMVPLENMNEVQFWENRPFSGVMPEPKRRKTGSNIILPIKKKAKRNRTAFTTKQLRSLELLFTKNKYITSEHRRKISQALNLGDKSVKIWFQNRRMKEKRESLESSRVETNSSTETFACENSPYSVVSTDSHGLDQNGDIMDDKITAESYQYQVPYFYAYNTNEQQIQNVHSSDYNTMQANGMQFYSDSNIYPTQYYPCNNYNNTDYNYYQYQQENFMQNNYCSLNNFASCFYNDRA